VFEEVGAGLQEQIAEGELIGAEGYVRMSRELGGGVLEELFDARAQGLDQFAGVGLLSVGERGRRHGVLNSFSSGSWGNYRFQLLVYKESTNLRDAPRYALPTTV
jgi:hypothetical protein